MEKSLIKVKDLECDFDTCLLRKFSTHRLGCGTPDAGGCPIPWCSDEELEMELEDFIKILQDRERTETDRLHKQWLKKEAEEKRKRLIELAWCDRRVIEAKSDVEIVKRELDRISRIVMWHSALSSVHSMFNQAGMSYTGDGIKETDRNDFLNKANKRIKEFEEKYKILNDEMKRIHRLVSEELIALEENNEKRI